MSSSNYGSNDRKIRIPIEIVPEESGITEEVRELQKSARQQISEGIREGRRRLFDEEHPEDAYPQRNHPALPGGGGMREYTPEKIDLKNKVRGIAPTPFRLGFKQPSTKGTASVPQGGQAPADITKKGIKKVTNPDAGLHIYGDSDEPGTIEKLLGKALGGPQKAQQAFGMLKNPLQLAKFLGPVAAPLIAALVAVEVTKKIIKELVRKGSVFDRTFKNVVDNRVEVLRTREQQQRYLVGFGDTAQLITTTSAGTTSPRDAYNTYEQFNNNNVELEEKFAIRDNSGYP
jgi:hypothetical protein